MRDLAFASAAGSQPRGLQRLSAPFRRLMRYLLRPIFGRRVERFENLTALLSSLEKEVRALRSELDEMHAAAPSLNLRLERLEGLEEDHLAVVRRLASLEDQAETLRSIPS